MITSANTPQLMTHTAQGPIQLSQITAAMQAWYDHPDFEPDIPVLWDMRLATIALPDEDLEQWSNHNREVINELRAGRKTAWVFGTTELADFAVDLLGSYDWQHKVRIFNNDIEAAVAWLQSSIR